MSRTYRRIDADGLRQTQELLDLGLTRWYNEDEREMVARCHSDNGSRVYFYKSPSKEWRRVSHKKARALEREQIQKVLKDPDHEFLVDLYNEAHGSDLWDWY